MKIGIVIPTNDDTSHMVKNCIKTMLSVEPSIDPSSIIISRGDDGFSKTVNRGAWTAIEGGADIVLLVNTDILFTVPFLRLLAVRFVADPKLGVMGAKLYYPNGTIQHAGAWNYADQAGHFAYGMDPRSVSWVDTGSYCQFVTGALFAFRSEVFREQGGFDERFFLGFEDSTFCYRAWDKGWRVLYDPKFTAIHAEGGTRGHISAEKRLQKEYYKIRENETQQTHRDILESLDWDKINDAVWESNDQYQETLVVLPGALGDIIALTAAIHKYKKNHQDHKIYVRTRYPEVFKGNADVEAAGPDIVMFLGRVVDCSRERQMRPWVNQSSTYFKPFGMKAEECWETSKPRICSKPSDMATLLHSMGIQALPAKYAVVHAGRTHWRNRDYPELLYRKIAHGLIKSKIPVVMVGTAHDELPHHYGLIDLRGRTTIHQLREVIRGASVYIGPDSGPMWVALSTETPTVLLFSSTLPKNTLPPGYPYETVVTSMGCAGCMHRQKPPVHWLECPENERYNCVNGFDADEIVRKAMKYVK